MFRRLALPLFAVLLLGPLAACGSADSGKPTVVASFYPLEYLVRSIAGDTVQVEDVTAPGVEPHDFEPKVAETAAIADARLVVYSRGLQPAVDDSVSQNAQESLDVSKAVDLTDDNPHFWVDPLRMEKAAVAVEKRLAELNPDHADEYAANLATLRSTLQDLDAAYRTGLRGCERDLVVTSHDAFGYLGRYGLRFAPITGLSPEAEPSPKHLAQLRDLIEQDGITTVFSETIASPKMADTLAHDLGISTAVLDPIEGLQKGSTDDYASLMRANLAALQKANGCPGAKVGS
ncbi:metal ABC transporter substrate-binding protein [Marmoricola sp. RAF53]|uniref:metal ABC transporter substrate-binding protein n=1 Tax=Marmoricola sp. RAF53 TaxID=3233059 RepID=UPI003F9BF5AD